MAEPELGKLTREHPRVVWANEAQDFTPWLEEHIDLLGDALGMDIEVTGREVAVGNFSLDLLGREANTDRPVIIENQLERTDHDHLGKLLTYAAGLDARTVVWISGNVRDEHREAVHWLNEHTADAVAFFVVEIEVLRIGDSLPGLRFNVVAQPSEFQRQVVRRTTTPPTEQQIAYQRFFGGLVDELHAAHPGFTRAKSDAVSTQPGKNFYSGMSGHSGGTWFSGEGEFWVETWIDLGTKEQNKLAFDQIHAGREAIEEELGGPLMWERKNDRKGCRVTRRRPGSIDAPEDRLEELKRWATDLLPRFRNAFAPRIAALDLDALAVEAATDEEAAP